MCRIYRAKYGFIKSAAVFFVVADVSGLPLERGPGFFIHGSGDCSRDSFSDTKGHYNPAGTQHPEHAGDLPPLMLCNGGAYLAVRTDRFCVREIIGRTVVIHSGTDDFYSQPAGSAGTKTACGVIRQR